MDRILDWSAPDSSPLDDFLQISFIMMSPASSLLWAVLERMVALLPWALGSVAS